MRKGECLEVTGTAQRGGEGRCRASRLPLSTASHLAHACIECLIWKMRTPLLASALGVLVAVCSETSAARAPGPGGAPGHRELSCQESRTACAYAALRRLDHGA